MKNLDLVKGWAASFCYLRSWGLTVTVSQPGRLGEKRNKGGSVGEEGRSREGPIPLAGDRATLESSWSLSCWFQDVFSTTKGA